MPAPHPGQVRQIWDAARENGWNAQLSIGQAGGHQLLLRGPDGKRRQLTWDAKGNLTTGSAMGVGKRPHDGPRDWPRTDGPEGLPLVATAPRPPPTPRLSHTVTRGGGDPKINKASRPHAYCAGQSVRVTTRFGTSGDDAP